MRAIQTTIQDWYGRQSQIRRLLSHLIAESHAGGPVIQQTMVARVWVLGAHDGSPPVGSYREWRFATSHPDFRGNYYEIWTLTDTRRLHLRAAYLTLYRVVRGPVPSEIEFLALHCDPLEPDDDVGVYKRGPHLHVSSAENPIPQAHLALNRGHLNQVLQTIGSLTSALEQAVRMLREEVLDRVGR